MAHVGRALVVCAAAWFAGYVCRPWSFSRGKAWLVPQVAPYSAYAGALRLDGPTLANLELLENCCGASEGSLMACLDTCASPGPHLAFIRQLHLHQAARSGLLDGCMQDCMQLVRAQHMCVCFWLLLSTLLWALCDTCIILPHWSRPSVSDRMHAYSVLVSPSFNKVCGRQAGGG